jgi:hypothetical protein
MTVARSLYCIPVDVYFGNQVANKSIAMIGLEQQMEVQQYIKIYEYIPILLDL